MASFDNANNACTAALSIQKTFATSELSLSVGLCHGDVVITSLDTFGNAANVAARVTALAGFGEIIATESVVELLSSDLKSQTQHLKKDTVRGKAIPINIYRVNWQEDADVTRAERLSQRVKKISQTSIDLRYDGINYRIENETQKLNIGRETNNGIRIEDSRSLVSRLHCSIKIENNEAIINDQSQNGCFVQMQNGQTRWINHQSIALHGSGQIVLGGASESEETAAIEFQIN
jgi:hypothetical protein